MKRALLLAVVLGTCGCGSDVEPPPALPELIPVTGNVKQDGKPLDGAVVIFVPQGAKGNSISAMGGTDAEGNYKLQTRSGTEVHDGAPAGEYKIFVTRMVKPDGTPLPPDPSTPPAMVGAMESIDPEFSNPGQSKLKATVAADKNKFDFEVKANSRLGGPPR